MWGAGWAHVRTAGGVRRRGCLFEVVHFCRKGLSLQGEPRMQFDAGYGLSTLVAMHTSRGELRSPARQAWLTNDCASRGAAPETHISERSTLDFIAERESWAANRSGFLCDCDKFQPACSARA